MCSIRLLKLASQGEAIEVNMHMEIIARGALWREAVSMNSDLTNCYRILFTVTNCTINKWDSVSPTGPKQLSPRAVNCDRWRGICGAPVASVLLVDNWGNWGSLSSPPPVVLRARRVLFQPSAEWHRGWDIFTLLVFVLFKENILKLNFNLFFTLENWSENTI